MIQSEQIVRLLLALPADGTQSPAPFAGRHGWTIMHTAAMLAKVRLTIGHKYIRKLKFKCLLLWVMVDLDGHKAAHCELVGKSVTISAGTNSETSSGIRRAQAAVASGCGSWSMRCHYPLWMARQCACTGRPRYLDRWNDVYLKRPMNSVSDTALDVIAVIIVCTAPLLSALHQHRCDPAERRR